MADPRPSLSKPPLNVLASPSALRGQKPWEIDLSGLLDIFVRATHYTHHRRGRGGVKKIEKYHFTLEIENYSELTSR